MNAISVIFPYKSQGQWMFDDETTGLLREPFVFGIDTMLDKATAAIPNADKGFKLLFSPTPFPGYVVKLEWRREEYGGNWYWCPQYQIEGWLAQQGRSGSYSPRSRSLSHDGLEASAQAREFLARPRHDWSDMLKVPA